MENEMGGKNSVGNVLSVNFSDKRGKTNNTTNTATAHDFMRDERQRARREGDLVVLP